MATRSGRRPRTACRPAQADEARAQMPTRPDAAGGTGPATRSPSRPDAVASPAPHPALFRSSTHGFVDMCEDVSPKDITCGQGGP
ncbi:hypothetical protein HBB16_15330 [Pseudonocardia sp. MCCB 268]|nr:hypothetical protein [Pseudonocardia cytotoxica]